jgi:hypothetical protein
MKGNISNNFFLNYTRVSVRCNSVFKSQSFKLSVSVKAIFHRLRNSISEVFDKTH